MGGKKIDVRGIVQDVLGLGPKNLVGIDIGLSSVKVCELQYNPAKRDSYKLVKYALVELPEGALIEDEIQKPEEVVEAIKQAISDGGIKLTNTCMGLSGPNTMAKRLQLPGGGAEEIEDQVMWESEQFIPFGIDESKVDYHIIGENQGGGVDVLIAAARNDVVDNFRQVIEDAGLKVKAADLDMFSLVNVFEFAYSDRRREAEASFVLIDFGAQKTNLVIYKNNAVVFTREMNIGGIMITEEIQRQLGLSYEEAENLKIEGDGQGNLPEDIVEIIEAVLETFFSEVKKTLNFYMTASSDENLEHCFITGGSSLLPGFKEGLEGVLGIEVAFLDPFKKIKYNEKAFDEKTFAHVGSHGCIVLGLAMRGVKK